MKKFEFKMDYDKQVLSLYVEDHIQCSWPYYSPVFTVGTVCRLLGVYGATPKARNKAFTEQYNITPSKFATLCKAVHYKYYISPVKEWVDKYGFTAYKKYPDAQKVVAILKVKDKLEQAKKDGIENIAPFIIKTGKSPHEMKKQLGKGLWKKLAHNSASRNKLIVQRTRYGSTIEALQSKSSTALKLDVRDEMLALRDIPWKDVVGGKINVKRIAIYISDYYRMQNQMGLPVSRELKWSTAGSLHNEAVRLYDERRRLSYIQDFNIPPTILREFKRDEIIFSLLTSGQQVIDEGREMHHCVGSYAQSVANGGYLVYKVEGGERATLGITISYESGKVVYMYQQCYKRCNEQVSAKTKAAALSLVAALNKEGKVIKSI